MAVCVTVATVLVLVMVVVVIAVATLVTANVLAYIVGVWLSDDLPRAADTVLVTVVVGTVRQLHTDESDLSPSVASLVGVLTARRSSSSLLVTLAETDCALVGFLGTVSTETVCCETAEVVVPP